VEWTNNTDQVDQLLIHFSKIKGFNLNGSCWLNIIWISITKMWLYKRELKAKAKED
jgi:hypothetical protein